jgi:hypothetical protein
MLRRTKDFPIILYATLLCGEGSDIGCCIWPINSIESRDSSTNVTTWLKDE